jgi:hypothetical protein
MNKSSLLKFGIFSLILIFLCYIAYSISSQKETSDGIFRLNFIKQIESIEKTKLASSQDTSLRTNEIVELLNKLYNQINVSLKSIDEKLDKLDESRKSSKNLEGQNESPNVKIFNFKKPQEPAVLYDKIECIKSAVMVVSTTICLHDLDKDVYVSKTLKKDGVWEFKIVSKFLA